MSRKEKWFFGSMLAYLILGLIDVAVKLFPVEFITIAWAVWMLLALTVKPIARLWGMKTIWED